MEYQKPAQGILISHDWGNSKMYTIPCECGSPDDTITLEIEADDGHISVTHYVTVKSKWWVDNDRFYPLRQIWNRLVLTYKLWVHGYVKYEATTLMRPQQAFNYAYTINQAIKDVEEFQKRPRG